MKVYKDGTMVTMILAGVEGMITEIRIKGGHVDYEISYFADFHYKTVFLTEKEFKVKTDNRITIGFKQNRK